MGDTDEEVASVMDATNVVNTAAYAHDSVVYQRDGVLDDGSVAEVRDVARQQLAKPRRERPACENCNHILDRKLLTA